jgi:hypothetical protein
MYTARCVTADGVQADKWVDGEQVEGTRREKGMIKKQKTGTGIEEKFWNEILVLTSIRIRVLK